MFLERLLGWSLVEKQTPATISTFMKEMLKGAKKVNFMMLPGE
ncbi:hypothetical protein ACTQ2R_11325 [Hallella faecis]